MGDVLGSQPLRRLDPRRGYKPLDVGNGLVSASVSADGLLVSVGTPHPEQGYVVLSGTAPFPDAGRYDQAAVRAYRAGLAAKSSRGFGLAPVEGWRQRSTALLADAVPVAELASGPVRARVVTAAAVAQDRPLPLVIQSWLLENASDEPVTWSYRRVQAVHLARASMTQLTEGGVVPMPQADVEVSSSGSLLQLAVAPLGIAAAVAWPDEHAAVLLRPGACERLVLRCALGRSPEEVGDVLARETDPDALVADAADRWVRCWRGFAADVPQDAEALVRRGIMYASACCAVPVGDTVCLVADHQILPLAWTRDAYYLARLLLARPCPDGIEIVRRHLLWLFEVAERSDGAWGRAYWPNGRLKDRAFQLDQQCYPLLELAEYVALTGDVSTRARLAPHLARVLDAIVARRAGDVALFASEESPADDPLAHPYHTSSHVLLWHTLRRLRPLHDGPLPGGPPERLAQAVRDAVRRHLVFELDGRRLYAYAADLHGGADVYHDANDLPMALAPIWGFDAPRDPVWLATMAFAFSTGNSGYHPGSFGGLGSRHTPGAWPLGDVQELVYARLVGDAARAEQVFDRLAATALWDGALPESRDPDAGAVASRHWFAWPGAALAAALLDPRWGV